MNSKQRIILVVVCILAMVFLAFSVEAVANPDIIMTPSYTNYLDVWCMDGGSAAYFPTDESNGELYCLPHRP